MKTRILIAAIAMLFCATATAQTAKAPAVHGVMVVSSEKVFRALPEYNEAITTIDNLANSYQQRIDDAFEAVEKMYDEYQSQRAYLNETQRQQREEAIVSREREITQFQEEVFGPEGEVMKKRMELIKPIQDRVFKVVYDYAAANNFSIVLDQSNNATLLYFSTGTDRSDEVIKLLTK